MDEGVFKIKRSKLGVLGGEVDWAVYQNFRVGGGRFDVSDFPGSSI